MKDFYETKPELKQLIRKDKDTSDFEKCLYIALEKLSEFTLNENDFGSQINNFGVIILGASGGRFDHTLNTFSIAYKYHNKFQELGKTEIILLSKSNGSLYLRPDAVNVIYLSAMENKDLGYSITCLSGEGRVKVTEIDDDDNSTEIGIILLMK